MNPLTRHYTTAATRAAAFSFPEWYARMGYHRHGGQKACAEALGVDTRYVRYLLEGERQPSKTLVIVCNVLQDRCDSGMI